MMVRMMTDKERIKLFNETVGKFIYPEWINWLIDNGFFMKPASIKYHGNYTGGLFDHSFKVMKELIEMTNKLGLEWQEKKKSLYCWNVS